MKILSSYSIKGGVGKTALAVNLAFALREAGHRTLLLDLDPQGAASLLFPCGQCREVPDARHEIPDDGLRRNIRESDFHGLDIIPSNLGYRHFDILLDNMSKRRRQLRKVLEEFKPDYDVILMDCPPNITLLSENVFRASDAILVPVIPTVLSRRTLEQLAGFSGNPHTVKWHSFFLKAYRKFINNITLDHPASFIDNHCPFPV